MNELQFIEWMWRRVKQNHTQEKSKKFAKSVGIEQQPEPEDSIISVAGAWWLVEEPKR